ncbi:MAG: hypothetical protein AMXMBFR64_45450 [Myxococcales bacterium]
MKALTIWQPWANAIMVGAKPVENREWFPPSSAIGTWIAIHAGSHKSDPDDIDFVRGALDAERAEGRAIPPMPVGPPSALLGVAFLAAAYRLEDAPDALRRSRWSFGSVLWHFTEVHRLHEPILGVRGAQGLWTVEDHHAVVLRCRRKWGSCDGDVLCGMCGRPAREHERVKDCNDGDDGDPRTDGGHAR